MESIPASSWIVPTVVVAIIGVLLQGIKAAWDLIISIKDQETAKETETLNRICTFMAFVDGMPIPSAEKTALKIDLINEGLKFNNKDLLYFLRQKCPCVFE